ncbi:Wadjet anti-phage system protein JetD domain-containing protein [Cellulosilyticum ruminicola]|uniref:Wadjet anti-phage system protein JetD domain-containing protein n=1 Tax=Cellulosilyticum ruminicola TaxID=425254 RepID=UPI0006D0A3CB|nr:Wadjet anti-phage system protein JetD domain-containing protein [Cellulosilyticum ruminicola]
MKKLEALKQKKIDLEALSKLYKLEAYSLLYEKVMQLVESGILAPIKSSGLNGKHPALYKRYKIVIVEKDTTGYKEELTYQMSTLLDVTYYLNHLDQYEADRQQVLLLNQYLKQREINEPFVSLNERSFEIWGREKFLKQEGGMTLLKRLGVSLDLLRVYETVTPVAYYVQHKNVPQTVLIVENMDTFYSIRQHLMQGNLRIADKEIGTLVYGAGKQIVKGFESFIDLGEVYLKHQDNEILYFGDLDYEGIQIYESLKDRVNESIPIALFTALYEKMLAKSECMRMPLPLMKEKQSKGELEDFLSNFQSVEKEKIKRLLEAGEYIPQEILSGRDF